MTSNETEPAVEWLTDTLDSLAPGGAWEDVAPAATPYPFISLTFMGGSDLMNLNDHRVWSDQIWKITGVAEMGQHATLGSVANDIDAALHRASGDTGTAHVYQCRRESPFRRTFPENGKRYRELGGLYRLRIQDPVAV